MPNPISTKTIGGFAAWTERAKDIVVTELEQYFSLLFTDNVLKEKPIIEKYGLAGQTSIDSFVNIFTTMPHEQQRIPFIAVMSSPGTERKLGIGRQVISTFRDPDTGLPTKREAVGGDMTIVIEIASVDTNMRSELTDLVFSFFTMYMEERLFSFLGDANTDTQTGDQNLYQLILKSQASIQGETQAPRPQGEGFQQIYYNRITVPIIFIDYVDREVSDYALRFNPNLKLEDDEMFQLRGEPLPFDSSPEVLAFSNTDQFESSITLSGVTRKWLVHTSTYSLIRHTTDPTDVISGAGSLRFDTIQAGNDSAAALVSDVSEQVLTGKIRQQFNLRDGDASFVLFAMLQGISPLSEDSYHILYKTGQESRFELRKGPIVGSSELLASSSKTAIFQNQPYVAQLEWKVDTINSRIRLRGYVSPYETKAFGALDLRLEFIDNSNPFLTSQGEGFGFKENEGTTVIATAVADKAQVLKDISVTTQNPAKIEKAKNG